MSSSGRRRSEAGLWIVFRGFVEGPLVFSLLSGASSAELGEPVGPFYSVKWNPVEWFWGIFRCELAIICAVASMGS